MPLPPSGQISIEDIREEFRSGTNSSGIPIIPSGRYAITDDLESDYWNGPIASNSNVEIDDFYGVDGNSGWFYSGIQGGDVTYWYGFREENYGGFAHPELADDGTTTGSWSNTSQTKAGSSFFVTCMSAAQHGLEAGYAGSFEGVAVAIWGRFNNAYAGSWSPKKITFKLEGSAPNNSTLGLYSESNHGSNYFVAGLADGPTSPPREKYYPINQGLSPFVYGGGDEIKKWVWEVPLMNPSPIVNVYNIFKSSYEQNKKVFWRAE